MTARSTSYIKQEIASYAKQGLRHKIVLCEERIEDLEYLNVGRCFARLLRAGKLPDSAIRELFSSSVGEDKDIGRYLAICNIGILWEPELKLDIGNLLDGYSKNHCLIIQSNNSALSQSLKSYNNEIFGTSSL